MYLEVNDLCKSYGEGGSYTQVLKNVSLEVQQGDMCVIQGTSGSGKSTPLNCIGGLDTVDSAAADDVEINLYGSGAAGVILMILFTYVISVFVVHTIEQESSIIGALYAMGVTRNQLLVHYLAAPVVVSWLGGVCGLLLSLTPIGCVQQMQDTYLYYSLP